MLPDCNVDRNWDGKREGLENYQKRTKELEGLCKEARESYKEYRILIKNTIRA